MHRFLPFVAIAVAACSPQGRGVDPGNDTPAKTLEGARARFGVPLHGDVPRNARVELAARTDDATRIVDATSGVEASVRPLLAASAKTSSADGVNVTNVAPGVTLLSHATASGFEDHLLFEKAPARAEASWKVSLGDGVRGLRLVDDTLELLDGDGTPRLRVAPPHLVDAARTIHEAKLAVDGCAIDTDGAPPWGRTPRDPGARTCTLRVRWDGARVQYPALLDPAWSTTGAIGTPRTRHTATTLPGGRVLIAGGIAIATGGTTTSVQIYDPTTNTFGAGNPLAGARSDAAAIHAPPSYVYVVGGRNGSTVLASTERFSLFSSTWSSGGNLTVGRHGHSLAFASNKVLATGGFTSTGAVADRAEENDSTNFWYQLGAHSPTARVEHFSAGVTLSGSGSISGQCVILFGGRTAASTTPLATSFFRCYGPDATNDWYNGPPMTAARRGGQIVPTGPNRYLITGGFGSSGAALSTTEIFNGAAYDPSTASGGFSSGPALPIAIGAHRATFIGDPATSADVLVVPVSSVASYLLKGGAWKPSGTLLANHGTDFTLSGLPTISAALAVGAGSPSAERWRQVVQGVTCTQDAECTTGFCADGVCCNEACTGLCRSCAASLKVSGPDGVCGNTKPGVTESLCSLSPAASCGNDGTCDGAGACRKWVSGTVCVAGTCASPTSQNDPQTCNGSGACSALKVTACATGYACQTTTGKCATACVGTDDSACAAGFHCVSGACVASKDLGAKCDRGRACKTGHCADGVCCDRACDGACEACTAAAKGSGADGTCANVPADTDPRGRCSPDPGYPASCKGDGMCDGAGKCRAFAKAGTACGAPTCASGEAKTSICDGSGVCELKTKSCAPSTCDPDGKTCLGDCADDSKCASTAYCDGGKCVDKKPDGTKSTEGRQCLSGFVADGVCCATPCTGICERCDDPKTLGTCTAVTGPGVHGSCEGGTAEDACTAKSCNGVERTECAGRAGSEVVCRARSCVAGVATLVTRCDGSGKCPAPETKKCEPFACDGDVCATTCSNNDHCATGYVCDPKEGKCSKGATCVDAVTLQSSDGVRKSCAPYRCAGNLCLEACTSSDDCASGYVCDPTSKACHPGGETSDSGGCAMGAPRSSLSFGAIALLAVGAIARRRRLRRPQ